MKKLFILTIVVAVGVMMAAGDCEAAYEYIGAAGNYKGVLADPGPPDTLKDPVFYSSPGNMYHSYPDTAFLLTGDTLPGGWQPAPRVGNYGTHGGWGLDSDIHDGTLTLFFIYGADPDPYRSLRFNATSIELVEQVGDYYERFTMMYINEPNIPVSGAFPSVYPAGAVWITVGDGLYGLSRYEHDEGYGIGPIGAGKEGYNPWAGSQSQYVSSFSITFDPPPVVPEPATMTMFGLGALGMAIKKRKFFFKK